MLPWVLAEAAIIDLQEIADYIARDNPERAFSFSEELFAKIEQIAERPLSFTPRDYWRPGLRSALHYPYHIVFEVTEEQVTIARVLHGARDIDELF